jgi:hypothetical protein
LRSARQPAAHVRALSRLQKPSSFAAGRVKKKDKKPGLGPEKTDIFKEHLINDDPTAIGCHQTFTKLQ